VSVSPDQLGLRRQDSSSLRSRGHRSVCVFTFTG
jgi:hypothetical protein